MTKTASAQSDIVNIVYVDLPGFGQTPSQNVEYTMDDIACSLKDIVDMFSDTDVYMMGYSMGGRTALAFACTYPEVLKGLILESASPGIADDTERQKRLQLDMERAASITQDYNQFIQAWENMGLFSTQKVMDSDEQLEQRKERLLQNSEEVADSLKKYGTGAQPSYWPLLKNIKIPALLLAGTEDKKFVEINRRMTEQLPHAYFSVIDGAGHNIHLEEPRKFDIIVSEFIKEDIHG